MATTRIHLSRDPREHDPAVLEAHLRRLDGDGAENGRLPDTGTGHERLTGSETGQD